MNLITNGDESAGDVAIVPALVKENLPDNTVGRGPEEVQKKANNKRETTCLFCWKCRVDPNKCTEG